MNKDEWRNRSTYGHAVAPTYGNFEVRCVVESLLYHHGFVNVGIFSIFLSPTKNT